MTHYCTACSSEFDDDSLTPVNAGFVHCVFCGAKISLPDRSSARSPTSVVPFSKDYEREEAFALGVINHSGPGFPDTLRQFRVPGRALEADSLSPLANDSEAPTPSPLPVPRRWASLSLSLSIGFGVGVAIAFAAVSMRPAPGAPPGANAGAARTLATVTEPARSGALPVPSSSTPAAAMPAVPLGASATPPPASLATPANAALAAPSTPTKATTPSGAAATGLKPPAAEPGRRWLLDRARAEQRQYHLTSAEQLYRQILSKSPRDSEALSGLGELDLLRGTLDLASAHFREALEANANYVPALIAAADLRWQAGQIDEARQAYLDIVDHYSADLYPPYVVLRSTPIASPPCER